RCPLPAVYDPRRYHAFDLPNPDSAKQLQDTWSVRAIVENRSRFRPLVFHDSGFPCFHGQDRSMSSMVDPFRESVAAEGAMSSGDSVARVMSARPLPMFFNERKDVIASLMID